MLNPFLEKPFISPLVSACFFGLVLSAASCQHDCLFVDQSENEISVLVSKGGEVLVVNRGYPEASWVCGSNLLAPRNIKRSSTRKWDRRPPHRPIPEGDVLLDSLASDTQSEKEQSHEG